MRRPFQQLLQASSLLWVLGLGCAGLQTSPSTPEMSVDEVAEVSEDRPEALSAEERMLREEEAEDEIERQEYAQREAHLARFRQLVAPLDPGLVEDATRIHEQDDFTAPFDAQERAGRVIVTFANLGSGVESVWDVTMFVYRGGQRVLRMSYDGYDGSYVQALDLDVPIDDAVRADVEQALDTQLATPPQGSRYGLGQLFVSVQQRPAVRRGEGFSVVGPLYSAGPRPAAFPLQAAANNVTPATLVEHGGRLIRVAAIRAECVDTTLGAHRLRHCGLVGRNGGVAVALMRGADSGEWVLETRNAVLGGGLDWLGEHQGWLFGYVGHSHSGGRYAGSAGLVALRTGDGAVFRIDVEGVFEDGYDIGHGDREMRASARQSACIESGLQQRGLSEDEVYATCESAEHPRASATPVSVDGRGLLVTRGDGGVTRVDFAKLMRVLR